MQMESETEQEIKRNGDIQKWRDPERQKGGGYTGEKGRKGRKEGGTEGPFMIFTFTSGQEPPSKYTAGDQALCEGSYSPKHRTHGVIIQTHCQGQVTAELCCIHNG